MSDLGKQVTLLTPHGYSSGTCGYCGEPGQRSKKRSSKKFGMIAPQMTYQFYQDMINRGWRRSGTYMYRPDNPRSCCPQLTIRLAVPRFTPGKKHRQVVNRWNRFLSTGQKPGDDDISAEASTPSIRKDRGKEKARQDSVEFWDILQEWENCEGKEGKHKFTLVPAKATPETYALYRKYQIAVHHDKPEKLSKRGFENFLCDSPLISSPIRYTTSADTSHLPLTYGSYHLLYRVDSHLVGISVIDILPSCVSSVYFIWDPDWAWASLGKLSALREAVLVKRMNDAGAADMQWLYMGFWIARCQKMRYKGEYAPSYLLDARMGEFHELTTKLDAYLSERPGHRPFPLAGTEGAETTRPKTEDQAGGDDDIEVDAEDNPDDEYDSDDDDEALFTYPSPPPEGMADPASISDTAIENTLVILPNPGKRSGTPIVRMQDLRFNDTKAVKRRIKELIAAVGRDKIAVLNGERSDLKNQAFLSFN